MVNHPPPLHHHRISVILPLLPRGFTYPPPSVDCSNSSSNNNNRIDDATKKSPPQIPPQIINIPRQRQSWFRSNPGRIKCGSCMGQSIAWICPPSSPWFTIYFPRWIWFVSEEFWSNPSCWRPFHRYNTVTFTPQWLQRSTQSYQKLVNWSWNDRYSYYENRTSGERNSRSLRWFYF